MRPCLYDLVIYNNEPYYIIGFKMDPNFITINSVFGSCGVTEHISNLTRTNLSLADIQNLDIISAEQFLNQFPEYFI